MKARIYKPAKSAMQSGRGHTAGHGDWVLEYETETPRRPEPLMGWTESGDTLNQVRMRFETREAAAAFAKRKGMDFTVMEPEERHIPPRNYGDNFRLDRPRNFCGRKEKEAAGEFDRPKE
jgi:hypothetical protein